MICVIDCFVADPRATLDGRLSAIEEIDPGVFLLTVGADVPVACAADSGKLAKWAREQGAREVLT